MVSKLCPVCNSALDGCIEKWHWECKKCGYECADFAPAINESIAHEKIDEKFREQGLRSLRVENFNQLLRAIKASGKQSGRILDVGCAHGWFLEAAQDMGFDVLGIEPDLAVCNATVQRGLPARQGFFPDALPAHEMFDVIVFNDVFEHIPDVRAVLAACRAHLAPEGMLVLNLPSSSGMFYQLSRWLCRLGVGGFFERLWQKSMPSPHLHYFNAENLKELLQGNGFDVAASGRLSTIRLKGLFARISYTDGHSIFVRLCICLSVALALPIIRLMPGDIIYTLASKKNA